VTQSSMEQTVAIIGAGPAGLYAAGYLAKQGFTVALFNRDIRLGGLADYGIFHTKHKMKNGLMRQFRLVVEEPEIHYYGYVEVGNDKDISLDELRKLGFSAIIVAVGAQGTKWLGLPGEHLKGVYHAKDVVYHYNLLPPYGEKKYLIGDNVVIVGMGNVSMDIATYMVRDMKVKQVTAIARRGPADIKFTKKELAHVIKNLDMDFLDEEIKRTKPILDAVGQDSQGAKDYILSALPLAQEKVSDTNYRLQFLMQPKALLGDDKGQVRGMEVEETTLEKKPDSDETKAVGLGKTHVIDCDTVVFCIGDRVDQDFGLPLNPRKEFAKNPNPRFPENDISYEAYDPESGQVIEDVFLAGWARQASTGLVGVARKDGESCAEVVTQYLGAVNKKGDSKETINALEARLKTLNKPVITKEQWQKLDEIEQQIAKEKNLDYFKFSTNEEMLGAIGLLEKA
jgi:ferredoxin--NADP+ reductase